MPIYNSHLKASHVRVKAFQYFRGNLNNQMGIYEQVLGDSGNEKLPVNRKGVRAEPGYRKE